MDLIVGFTQYFADLDETKAPPGVGRHLPDRRQEGQQCRHGSRPRSTSRAAPRRADARAPAGGARPARARDPVRLSRADQRGQEAGLRLPQPDIRADALSDQRDAARLLFHLGNAGGHAVRPGDRRAAKELRRRELRRRGFFRRRQELLPARPAGQGDVWRGRLGVDQCGGGAPLVLHSRRRLLADRVSRRWRFSARGG